MKFTESKVWEILVPFCMNGKNVPFAYHEEWDAKVIKITKGLTIGRRSKGKWLDESRLCAEPMISVRIACTEEQLKEVMRITMEHYQQDAIFASMISEKSIVYEK